MAFCCDPAWEARMAPGKLKRVTETSRNQRHLRATLTPLAGATTWQPVNKNGSQRGGRPVIQFLPRRIQPDKAKITAGGKLHPVIVDNFILVPLP